MSRAELVRAIKEHARAVRVVAVRRDVGPDPETLLREIAAGLDELAIEVTLAKAVQS